MEIKPVEIFRILLDISIPNLPTCHSMVVMDLELCTTYAEHCCIWDCHAYRELWEALVEVQCWWERGNASDPHSVVVVKFFSLVPTIHHKIFMGSSFVVYATKEN